MRVIDYINQSDTKAVVSAYAEAYGGAELDATAWNKFKAQINAMITVQTDMTVCLSWVHEKWTDKPGCGVDEEYVSVSGKNSEADNWSLSFTDWSDWKSMLLVDATGKDLTIAQIAAHLFYEMTWHGGPQVMIGVRGELMDRVEAIERGEWNG